MNRFAILPVLSALAITACAGAEAAPPSTAQKTSTDTASADHDLCVAMMTHARTCTDQFIPALVDARAAADHPAGIKEAVAKDRDGTIAAAKTEWASDGTDANIEKMCARPMPNADAQRDAARTCQATTDCAAFAQCLVPIEAASWQ